MIKFFNQIGNKNIIICLIAKRLLLLIAIVSFNNPVSAQNIEQPNIVFIAIDDMNDWTGFLGGHPQASTPNMDKLASEGVNFTNAHCSAPGCSPSRNSLLYGIEPFNSGLYPFYDHDIHTELHEKYTSLPRLLKSNGYDTYGAGKIHHGPRGADFEWTDYHETSNTKKVFAPNEGHIIGKDSKMSFRPTINPYEEHVDYQVASYGVDILEKKHKKPFFLAVGIVKPHLPFDAPKPFFDALPQEVLAPHLFVDDLDDIGKEANSFRRVADVKKIEKDNVWNEVRRAYLACNSWADYNIGRVLDALEKSPYATNTVVVLWSDHGFHLGEKMSFKKFTLWEEATRVPFIIKDFRDNNSKGRNVTDPVSLINIYKTIAEYTGVKTPDYVDGTSLVSFVENKTKTLATPAITSWGRGNYAVRTQDWRYIKYFDGDEELYNHNTDKNEWYNIADKQEFLNKKEELKKYLPKNEVPTVEEYISLWSIQGADKKRLKNSISQEERNQVIEKQKKNKKLKKQSKKDE